MKLIWQVDPKEIKQARAFFLAYEHDPFVRERQRRNLAKNKPPLVKTDIWRTLVACLLSTQQRSGPLSAISRFVSQRPFPFAYDHCLDQSDLESWAYRVMRDFGGIRRHKIVAAEVTTNLALLEQGLWSETIERLDGLRPAHSSPHQERAAAEFIRCNFKGFGPKQSRNLLQSLGLTRYEIPIDSRIVKWLNQFGFPLQLSATTLSDPGYYNLVSDGLQQLCRQSDLFPCLLDAAIFASYDDGGWTEENVVW